MKSVLIKPTKPYKRNVHYSAVGLSRTKYWFYRIFFYLGFYTILFATTALILKTICDHLYTVNTPYQTGKHSLLKLNPGLAIVPIIDFKSKLIHYNPSVDHTLRPYQDALTAFTRTYDRLTPHEHAVMDCQNDTRAHFDPRSSCYFDLDWSGECNMFYGYGYSSGTPCIIVKLNKVFGWMPDLEENERGIRVWCEGTTPFDTSLIEKIRYFDYRAKASLDYGLIPHFYFPYLAQENYQSPLVFVMLHYPKKHVVIRITCRATAKNLNSSSTFELFLE